jgi:hypothetical protein
MHTTMMLCVDDLAGAAVFKEDPLRFATISFTDWSDNK